MTSLDGDKYYEPPSYEGSTLYTFIPGPNTSYCLCQITANVAIEIREGGGPFSLVVKLAGTFYLRSTSI